jgi:hypothetical protein
MAYSKARLKSSGDKLSPHEEKASCNFLMLLQVIDGQAVVHKIEQVETNSDDQPVKPVVITESGILLTPAPFYISDESYE